MLNDSDPLLADLWRRHWVPPTDLTVSEWADTYRVISSKGASEPGPWRTARTPYLREIMDALSRNSDVHEVVLWFASQMGKSEAINNWLGYLIHLYPGPVLMMQPTEGAARKYSRQRIAPLIDDIPELRQRVVLQRSRQSGNTILEKEFEKGVLFIAGANTVSSAHSTPLRDIMLDEIDRYPTDVGGDPISLMERRQDNFPDYKRIKTSTCSIKGESPIEQAYLASDQRRYWVPCPECGEYQLLEFERLQWDNVDPETVRYACCECAVLFGEMHKTAMLAAGEWRAENPASRIRGYWLNSLYRPLGWSSWAELIRQQQKALVAQRYGDHAPMRAFWNAQLARTWELEGERNSEHELAQRAEPYPLRMVPEGVLFLTASVDVQGDRLEYLVLGWGHRQECWVVDYGQIFGDPADEDVWSRLETEVIFPPVMDAEGRERTIEATAVDHGGHHSVQVEAFARMHAKRRVIAVKGQSQRDKPVIGKPHERDVTWRGKKVKAGVRIWPVGTDTAKDVLYQRLRIAKPGPGYLHTSDSLPDAFYEGLTAEQRVIRYVRGRKVSEWRLPRGRRNEPLDLWVYAYAAAAMLGMLAWDEARWQWVADKVREVVQDAPERPRSDFAGMDVPEGQDGRKIAQRPSWTAARGFGGGNWITRR